MSRVKLHPLKKIFFTLLTLIWLAGCSSNDSRAENDTAKLQPNEAMTETIVSSTDDPQIFENIYTETGHLESRAEMSEILKLIGAANSSNEEILLKNVVQTHDGYTGYEKACDYDYNGVLHFIIGQDQNKLTEPYGFFEPVMEHQSQDLFIYAVEEIFVFAEDEKLSLTIRYADFDAETGNYYSGPDQKTETVKIWRDFEFGTIAQFNDRFYLSEKQAELLPDSDCPAHEH